MGLFPEEMTIDERLEYAGNHGRDSDSCWGFYGRELEDTGMPEHLPEYMHEALERAWRSRQ